MRRCSASFLKPAPYFRPKFRINHSRPFHEFDAILLGTGGGVGVWGGGGQHKCMEKLHSAQYKLRVIDFPSLLFVTRDINPAEGFFGHF